MKTQCAATVFTVTNLDQAFRFYVDVLGFSEGFRFERYAGVTHGEVLLHLNQNTSDQRPPGSGAVYIFCDEVDSYYRQITERGAKTAAEPKDYPYGMRDFIAFDPDGNQVSFGTSLEKT